MTGRGRLESCDTSRGQWRERWEGARTAAPSAVPPCIHVRGCSINLQSRIFNCKIFHQPVTRRACHGDPGGCCCLSAISHANCRLCCVLLCVVGLKQQPCQLCFCSPNRPRVALGQISKERLYKILIKYPIILTTFLMPFNQPIIHPTPAAQSLNLKYMCLTSNWALNDLTLTGTIKFKEMCIIELLHINYKYLLAIKITLDWEKLCPTCVPLHP